MDVALLEALVDPAFRLLLLPLAGKGDGESHSRGEKRTRSASRDRSSGSQKQQKKIEELQQQLRDARSGGGGGGRSDKGKGRGKGKGKGKDKGKRTGVGWSPNMPPEIRGKAYETTGGDAICFSYNMSCGCTKAAPGKKCPRGLHVCCEPGCFANHALPQHV
jgi:hypothetical protein